MVGKASPKGCDMASHAPISSAQDSRRPPDIQLPLSC